MTGAFQSMHSLFRILRLISSQVRKENLHRVAFALLGLILLATVAFWHFEKELGFIRGKVQPKVLEKANLKEAQTVILLSDDDLDTHVRDAKTILDTLTIKSLYPEVYVCVELIESKNIEHCQMAKADEIIVVGELSTNLLVQAALDHGITHVITELVSNRYGNELYKIGPLSSLVGLTFFEVMCELKKNHGILCLAVENRENHKLIANPDAGYRLGPEDELVVIAMSRPQLS